MKITISVLILTGLFVLLFATVNDSNASESDEACVSRLESSAWKLGRGITNIVSAPYELYACMTNSAIEGAYEGSYIGGFSGYMTGAMGGYLAGSVTGIVAMIRQMNQGLLQTATFWRPGTVLRRLPPTRTPDVDFGPDDYCDPDPFWFNGPIPPKYFGIPKSSTQH